MPVRTLAKTLTTQIFVLAQGEVDDAALPAIHWIELKGNLRFADFFCCRSRAHTQFLNAKQAVVIGVETDARVLIARHPQHLHRDLFKRQHRLGFVRQKPIYIATVESDQQIGSLEILVRGCA
jgi:hypothetical protein